MTPAEHITAWIDNDQALHGRRWDLSRLGGGPDVRALRAVRIAGDALMAMRRGGEQVGTYTSLDVVKAAEIALEWEVEA